MRFRAEFSALLQSLVSRDPLTICCSRNTRKDELQEDALSVTPFTKQAKAHVMSVKFYEGHTEVNVFVASLFSRETPHPKKTAF